MTEERPTGQAAAKQAIRSKFEQSGNMAKMFGGEGPPQHGVAEGNAQIAHDMAQEQDRTHKGSPPEAQSNLEPQPSNVGPEGNIRIGSEQNREQYGDQRVPLSRLNKEIAKRKDLEAQLQSLNQNPQVPNQPQHQAQPPMAPSLPEGMDPEDPVTQQLLGLASVVGSMQQQLQGMQSQAHQSELVDYFNGDRQLAQLVNEAYRDGQADISMDEAYLLTKVRYPEVFGKGDPIQQGGPAGYVEPPQGDQTMNRQMPDDSQQKQQGDLLSRLQGAGNEQERRAVGKDLIMKRLFG